MKLWRGKRRGTWGIPLYVLEFQRIHRALHTISCTSHMQYDLVSIRLGSQKQVPSGSWTSFRLCGAAISFFSWVSTSSIVYSRCQFARTPNFFGSTCCNCKSCESCTHLANQTKFNVIVMIIQDDGGTLILYEMRPNIKIHIYPFYQIFHHLSLIRNSK